MYMSRSVRLHITCIPTCIYLRLFNLIFLFLLWWLPYSEYLRHFGGGTPTSVLMLDFVAVFDPIETKKLRIS